MRGAGRLVTGGLLPMGRLAARTVHPDIGTRPRPATRGASSGREPVAKAEVQPIWAISSSSLGDQSRRAVGSMPPPGLLSGERHLRAMHPDHGTGHVALPKCESDPDFRQA